MLWPSHALSERSRRRRSSVTPNIVAAYDADEANGVHFLVMEYVEGKDLSALVKRNGPFPVSKAVNYVLQAAKGLEFAHGEGVVHRDIKPANLLLDKKGVVKILDMGLARIEAVGDVATQAELTGTGTIMGTVDYMAPEQGLSTKHADARADIYSLGCTLHYLLIGKPAYGGETVAAKLVAHHNQPIPDLRQLRDDVPKQLQAAFRKMVAKKMEDRYQTMTEVVADLEKCQSSLVSASASEVTSVWQSSADDESNAVQGRSVAAGKRPPWKNPKVLVAAGAAGLVALLLGIWVIIKDDKIKDDKEDEVARVLMLEDGSVEMKAQGSSNLAGTPKPLVAPFDAKQAHAGQAAWAKHLGTKVETINSVGIRLTLIPPGEFLMGSTPEQVAIGRKMGEDDKFKPLDAYFLRLLEEMPQHKVTITEPFLMGNTEVTVAQFRKFVEATKYVTEAEKFGFGNSGDKTSDKAKEADKGMNWRSPGYVIVDDTPVTQVTWNDACACCAWLSEQEQRRPWYRPDGNGGWLVAAHADGYRLPTEAEWEYACRAGTTTQYSFGDDKSQSEQYGWSYNNAPGKAQPVALKRPNPFGLFDMHGNAYEWCQDWHDGKWYEKSSPSDPIGPSSGSARVFRGGVWSYGASVCRSAYRPNNTPSYRTSHNGFRCVRVLDASADSQLATSTTPQPIASATSGSGQSNQPWNTPAFQAWVKATQALPAEKQVEAVSKKLQELNPGFDGKVTHKTENGAVTQLNFTSDKVADVSPVRALAGLKLLYCNSSIAAKGKLFDLSPLHGMKLTGVFLSGTLVLDLSPLQGMPLTGIVCSHTKISDLSPMRAMPLASLICHNTLVSDLSPLQDCRTLASLNIANTKVTAAQVAALQKALPNCKIEWDDPAKPKTPEPAASGTK